MESSEFQTKQWRIAQKWYKNGKHNECENYQKMLLENITSMSIKKTNDRIYIDDRESIDYARKRISFSQAYFIISKLLTKRIASVRETTS
jgi:hypothetical protein